MDLDQFRQEMESYWRWSDGEAAKRKDSVFVEKRMLQLYGRFDPPERLMANRVLSEWVLSQDEAMRFTARVLVRELKIGTAVPALEKLAERLGEERSPGAPFELDIVKRLIMELTPE